MSATPIRWHCDIAWSGDRTGLFTIGRSTIDGTDGLAGFFGGNVYDELWSEVKSISTRRGRDTDLSVMRKGGATITLKDTTGKYNVENASSPLVGLLLPMRPVRIYGWHYPTTIMRDGPLAYYRLDETGGVTAADLTASDLDATLSASGISYAQSGALLDGNGAMTFDGVTGVFARTLTGLNTTAGLYVTVEAWLKPTAENTRMPFGFTSYGLRLQSPNTGFFTNNNDIYGLALSLNDGNWHHVVAVFYNMSVAADIANCKLYIDGVQQTLSQRVGTPLAPSCSEAFRFSGWPNDVNYRYAGGVDELAIYNGQLSAAQVLAHYYAGIERYTINVPPHVFSGFTETIQHDPIARESVIECVDFLEWLEAGKPTVASLGATTVGAAIGEILDALEWTDPDMRNLDTGDTIADFSADGSKSGMTLIEEMLLIDRGLLAPKGNGVVRYQDRSTRWRRRAVDGLLPGSMANQTRPGVDLRGVVNRQTVTKTGGTAQTYTDETSRKALGYRDGSAIDSSYLASNGVALSLATFLVMAQKDGKPRALPVRVFNLDDAAVAQQLGRELGEVVTVSESLGSTSFDGFVEGIRQHIRENGTILETTFLVVKRPVSGFTIGISVLDGPDVLLY